jgi:hypothetical protein
MPLNLVRVLGWVVIAHGISHAVLPLRGAMAPALLIDDWFPVTFYIVTTTGFVTAGLGLLGVRPLDRAISPLLVLSSGLSLVLLLRFGDPALAWGALIDAGLLLLGLWRSAAGWPAHPRHARVAHLLGVTIAFVSLAYVATNAALWPWHRVWGSTRDELMMALPGDRPDRRVGAESQHAVTIDAPLSAVWPFLVQLGRDRTAQQAYKNGRPGESPGWRVAGLEDSRYLVLDGRSASVLLPTDGGGTRFIIRSDFGHRAFPVWAAGVEFMAFELPRFIMERRMMLDIKKLAEQHAAQSASVR